MPSIETVMVGVSALLLLSIIASKISARFSIPALLLFIGIGMLAGSEGIGRIYFDDPQTAQIFGVVALIFILFSGGFDTPIEAVRPVFLDGIVLATLGVLVTAMVVAGFADLILGFSPLEGLLLGSIVASTDAAAVFSILGSQKIGLKGKTRPLLELESGSNDPMAVFLTLGAIQLLTNPDATVGGLFVVFIRQFIIGTLFGYGLGRLMALLINLLRLEYEGLYPVVTIAFVLMIYGSTALLGGNGFLAVYLAGLTLGSQNFAHKRSLARFHDGIAWLMQILMFLTLGLLVFPSELWRIAFPSLILAVVLIFVARPVGMFISLFLSKFDIREKLFISWVGLRGATPIVLATFPLLAGIPQADTIFNVVFFVVLTSVLLQGTMIVPVAKLLGVDAPLIRKPEYPFELVSNSDLKSELMELPVPEDSAIVGRQIVRVGLPAGCLIVLIARQNEIIVPGGTTIIAPGDTLLILGDKEARETIEAIIHTPR